MPVEVQTLNGQEVIWEALPRQDVALTCPAFEVCYGGTKGGGKTDFLVMAPWGQIAYAHSQWKRTGREQRGRAICFRKNVKNLVDLIKRSRDVYPALDTEMGIGGWNSNERKWTFSSGYTVEFTHLDGPDDHLGYNGQEITALLFDQVEEIPFDVYNFLRMQVRSKDPEMRRRAIVRCTANPGGKHAAWVKSYFYEGCKPHNTLIRETIKLSRGRTKEVMKAFVPARLSDNPYLDEDGSYEANLMRLPDWMRQMYLDGNWDVVIGARFAHLWRPDIHLINSFPIPGTWQVKGGLDWGSTAPACAHIGARDNDGAIYFIDELHKPGDTGRKFGEAMIEKFINRQKWSNDRKWNVGDFYFLMDRQARASTGADGRYANAAAGIGSYGWRLFDANKDRHARVEQWSERLTIQASGKPKVYIFKDRCPQLASVIPTITADPGDTEDCDPDFPNDHPYDSSGFLLMDWPIEHPRYRQAGPDKDVERWMELARLRKRPAEDEGVMTTGYGD